MTCNNICYTPVCLDGANIGGEGNERLRSTYIPAQMQAIFDDITYTPAHTGVIQSVKVSWWETNSFFNYPYMLITAFYGMQIPNFREYFNIPKDFILLGDSGGFQNMTMGANLEPISVLRWQEKNCDIGFTFDLPLLEKDLNIRKQKMRQTAINAKVAYDNRQNKNMKLYACFHGQNVEEQLYMLNEYENNVSLHNFDGIAYGGLVGNATDTEHLISILTLFCHNVSKYKKPIHFFGLSGRKIIPYIHYLSKKYDLAITFDSSSYGAGALRREFWSPNYNMKESLITTETNMENIPCDCPVCSRVKKWSEYQKPGSLAGALVSLHNLYVLIKYVNNIKTEETQLDENYKRYIDTMYEYGPNKALQLITPIPDYSNTQKSLFSF